MEQFAIEGAQHRVGSAAEPPRSLNHRVEHRGEVAGRGIDDAEHLGGRGVLLQGLTRLGNEARVLHRDDRLRREILQQRYLLVGERPYLLAVRGDVTEQSAILPQRYDQYRADA